jgi:hypothetical protein
MKRYKYNLFNYFLTKAVRQNKYMRTDLSEYVCSDLLSVYGDLLSVYGDKPRADPDPNH